MKKLDILAALLLIGFWVCFITVPMLLCLNKAGQDICEAIRSIEVNNHNVSNIRTPSVTILDGGWNVAEEKGE